MIAGIVIMMKTIKVVITLKKVVMEMVDVDVIQLDV